MKDAPFRQVDFKDRQIDVQYKDDGSIIIRNTIEMEDPHTNLIEPLRHWAQTAPERTWLAQRRGPDRGWKHLSYRDANDHVHRVAQALIDRKLGWGQDKHAPLMILSGNSLEHAVMTYGAILAGVPVAPVSRAYSLMSSDFAKLKYVFELIEPGMLFVQDGAMFGPALKQLNLSGVEVVYVDNKPDDPSAEVTAYDDLLKTEPGAHVEDIYEQLSFDHVAKYLFTSGSTGMPKAVINTHRMMCVNAQMNLALQHRDPNDPPVQVAWMPWNHTMGGNAVLNTILTSGGTMYLDDGLPIPGLFDETIRNLREISPTNYSNTPSGYAMLVPHLEQDEEMAKTFFARLKTMAYGGAALGQDLHDRMQAVALKTVGEKIPFITGYGATETAPTITGVFWATDQVGLIGLPLPGVDLKLVPHGAKMEVRVRGDAVTPGYYKNPEKTAEVFDEDGFYSLGDAAKLLDPEDPAKGLVFDGRVAEDFKLDTGTWVNAGRLRLQAIDAADGLFTDCLIAGQDKAFVGVLGFPNFEACKKIAGRDDLSAEDLVRDGKVLAHIKSGLDKHNKAHPGSSTRLKRALLMVEPPSLDAGEMTDKGYINQATALDRRKAYVERLYAEPPGNDVVVSG